MRLPGIGPVTARLLWEKFGSIEAMRAAKIEDWLTIPGIGPAKAGDLMKKFGEMQI
jgi:excinuclease ABC subunit C